MESVVIRDYRDCDGPALDRVAVAAFSQYSDQYSDWPAMADRVSQMSQLASSGQVIVAEEHGRLMGGVVYVPEGQPKLAFFDPSWSIIRLLVVDPEARGRGIGRRLTEECIARARRDKAPLIALHTSKMMSVALPMYLRLGFELTRDAPAIYGVPYAVYAKVLG